MKKYLRKPHCKPTDIFRGKDRRLLFRADCALPMGVPPASPMFQAQLRLGESFQRSFDLCSSSVEQMVMAEHLGGDGPLWSYLDECTERQSRVNPSVSLTTNLDAALRYARKGSKAYISVIVPESVMFRTVDFSEQLHVGNGKQDREVGIAGALLDNELIVQIPVDCLTEDLKNVFQNVNSFSRWLQNDGSDFLYQSPGNMSSKNLFCPDCREPFPIYFHRQLGCNSDLVSPIRLDPKHINEPFRENLVLARGAAVKCLCGRTFYSPQIDNQELVILRDPIFHSKYMEVDIENKYGSNIDTLWLWVERKRSKIRKVRQFRLRERSAEKWYRYPKILKIPPDKVEAWLKETDRSIPPGVNEKVKLGWEPRSQPMGVFGANFSDGFTWIPIMRLNQASWDTRTGVNEI